MNNKKKVLIFIPKLCSVGGAEVNVVKLNNMLDKYFDVSFFTLHKGDVDLNNIECLNQKEYFLTELLQMIPNAWRLKKKCRQDGIDVIISNLPRPNTVTILSKLLFNNKARSILTTRSANPTNKTTNKIFIRMHGIWMKFFWNRADKNIAVSQGVKKSLVNIGIRNVDVIYNPFDFNKVEKSIIKNVDNNDKPIFLGNDIIFINVGRLIKAKGQKYLIDAFAKINNKYKNTKLIILGDGPLKNHLRKQIIQLKMEDRVLLLGNKSNVFPYLNKADCFVLSSLWEGLPTVLIEAILSGQYVISTDCIAGPREILFPEMGINDEIIYPQKNKLGTLIAPLSKHNEKNELVKAMEYYINKKPKRDRNKDNKIFLKKFHKNYILKKWLELLKELGGGIK